MKLSEYLKSNKISTKALAEIIGCSQSYVSLVRLEKRRVSVDMAVKFEMATGGDVSRMELLYPDDFASQQ